MCRRLVEDDVDGRAEVDGRSEVEEVDGRTLTFTVPASLWVALVPSPLKNCLAFSKASLILSSDGLGPFVVVFVIGFVLGFAGRVFEAFSNCFCEMSTTCAKWIPYRLISFTASAGT